MHLPLFVWLRERRFACGLSLLLALAVAHTLWSTSLDSFTIDEPYHIAAGASYVRFHDFRVNPEHPPLVKLVAGLFESRAVLHLDPPGIVEDKAQERVYTQTAVYLNSDYHAVQRRSRLALIVLNTLLLALVTLALRRAFSEPLALAALLLLALDPTVSAHMPVVMTDLPMALLGTLCCALAIVAVRRGSWVDWTLLGLASGALLATKHSAPLILLPVFAAVCAILLWRAVRLRAPGAAQQFLRVGAAIGLAVLTLWSAYEFRFHESSGKDAQGHYIETFNRSLAAKITDLHSPLFRRTLTAAEHAHLLPRSYLWGMADTLRAGVESRPQAVTAFSRDFEGKAPWWVAFAFLVVKVPLPFLAMFLASLVALAAGWIAAPLRPGLLAIVCMFAVFMAFIARNGVFYAGVRHWLFAIPLMAIVAAAFLVTAWASPRPWLKAIPVFALLAIAITVLPQRRIWEYHNALAGGSANAWLHFDNESVDLGQRSDEVIAYTKAHILPGKPFWGYATMREQLQAEHVARWNPTPDEVGDGHLTGWFLFESSNMPSHNWMGVEEFRNAVPVARFGNARFYHGTFFLPLIAGGVLGQEGLHEEFLAHPDLARAENYLKRGLALNPQMWPAAIELGNFALKRHQREEAIAQYQRVFGSKFLTDDIRHEVQQQIDQVRAGSDKPMRNPALE